MTQYLLCRIYEHSIVAEMCTQDACNDRQAYVVTYYVNIWNHQVVYRRSLYTVKMNIHMFQVETQDVTKTFFHTQLLDQYTQLTLDAIYIHTMILFKVLF